MVKASPSVRPFSHTDTRMRPSASPTTSRWSSRASSTNWEKPPGKDNSSAMACPSVSAWIDAFGRADTVYAVTITSALSGSYNSARIAADIYQQDNSNASVHVFDSLSTGPEILLILEKLEELTAQGLDFDQVVAAVEAYCKKTRLFFSLHSLHNLAQNGRVSKVTAAAVGVMNIRVLGTA